MLHGCWIVRERSAIFTVGSEKTSGQPTQWNEPSCIRELDVCGARPDLVLILSKILQQLRRPIALGIAGNGGCRRTTALIVVTFMLDGIGDTRLHHSPVTVLR